MHAVLQRRKIRVIHVLSMLVEPCRFSFCSPCTRSHLLCKAQHRTEGSQRNIWTSASLSMCLFSIAQEYWAEIGDVYFVGTRLDRDVSAPYSARTPEEHRYALRFVSQKISYIWEPSRERGFGHCMLEELLKFIQSFKRVHPEISSSCSNCVVCG